MWITLTDAGNGLPQLVNMDRIVRVMRVGSVTRLCLGANHDPSTFLTVREDLKAIEQKLANARRIAQGA